MATIDASNLIMGRMATVVAKRALSGETMNIVNCEKVVISGKRRDIFEDYRHKLARGGPQKGPYFPRKADAIVRRVIRGMLPYKQAKGKFAFQKVMCHVGIPEELAKEKLETIDVADASRLKNAKTVQLSEIAIYLGGKL
jgi:large subunit ribosomal protein L13